MNNVVPREKLNFFSKSITSSTPGTSANKNDDDSIFDVEGKVKTRLLSMWNNVKYGWKLKTNFSKESPVWLLGKCYHRKLESPASDTTELGTDAAFAQSQGEEIGQNDSEEGFEGFKSDFISRIWMTYRREFPFLNGSTLNTDCGWGCMLRSGQMLLAQALVCHFLGRGWRWNPDQTLDNRQEYIENVNHRKIIKWFGDKPSRNSPFSIHALVSLGEDSGKRAGDWYGPGSVAHLLRQALKQAAAENGELESLIVYVAQDCAIYMKDIQEEMGPDWKSLILLVPVRLGTEKLNPIYAPCLTGLLSLECCIGIIGGKPKHSLYFVGYQDDKLIHLDPHYCQETVDVWAADFPLSSFHCRSPRKLHLSKLDPSCCIGFYASTRKDFYDLIGTVRELIVPPTPPNGDGTRSKEYPMFVFCNGHSRDVRTINIKRPEPPQYEFAHDPTTHDDIESEEFEIL